MIGRWAQRFATAIESPFVAYLGVLGAVAVAAAVRGATGLIIHDAPVYMAFFPAILFATLIAGARGGSLAALCSIALIWALWLPEAAANQTWAAQHVQLLMFAVAALLTVVIAKALRLAIQRGVAAEERFKVFQDQALDAFVMMEPVVENGAVVDFTWTYANPAAERTAPAQSGGLAGRRVGQVFPDDTGREVIARLRGALAAQGPDDVEVRRVIDGREHWMRSSAVALERGVAVTYRDVTSQRHAEQTLRAGESRVRALVDSLPQLLWSNRVDGVCDYISPQWAAFTGAPPEAHHGSGWLDALHPQDRDGVRTAWEQTIKGALPFDVECRLARHDGVWRWFNARSSAVRDDDGTVRRWFGAATDITEIVEARRDLEERVAERTRELEQSLEQRARAEAALAQAQRLETVGRLTGGVAHDFNNLLTVVIGGLDMILKHPDDVERVTRMAEAALSAGRRGERLTRQLLAFSRRQELKLEVVDITALIEQVEPLIRRAVGEAVPLSVTCEPAIGASRVDPAQFEAALLNLVVNAADAVRDGGGIEISTGRTTLAEGQIPGAAAGDYLRVSVADSGIGMASDVLQRAFEPFFTTKDVGKGTGLGLAQVYGFIRQSGGAATIESRPDQGTTVALYLPAADGPVAVEAAAPPPMESGWAKGARVLLVEDDAGVRAVTEGLLAELGCEVAAEADGPAALKRLTNGEHFDLLISDIVMPGGMSGVDLARAARAGDADLPIVLTTGYAGERLGPTPEDAAWPVLRKPFRAEQLSAAVRQALGRETERA